MPTRLGLSTRADDDFEETDEEEEEGRLTGNEAEDEDDDDGDEDDDGNEKRKPMVGSVHSGLKLFEIDAFISCKKTSFPQVSGASERVNGRASGPVLTSRFLFVPEP